MKRVCVFCGSSRGNDPRHAAAAAATGDRLGQRGLGLVFGGGSVGLMGVLADHAIAAGAQVIGVIPHGLAARELAHPAVSDLRVVPTMHARKALMASLADGFLALPGGFGTFDELFEILTWGQLGIHRKPVGLLNVADYYAPLEALMDHAVAGGFVSAQNRRAVLIDDDPDRLLSSMDSWQAPAGPTWISPDEA